MPVEGCWEPILPFGYVDWGILDQLARVYIFRSEILIYSHAWVRAIATIALLAQWGGQGHAAGEGHGSDSPKKIFHPNVYPLWKLPRGNFWGARWVAGAETLSHPQKLDEVPK
jgi:hypothetical protein